MINYEDIKVGDTYQSTIDKRMKVKILSVSDEVINTGFNTYTKEVEIEQIFGGNIPSRKTTLSVHEHKDGSFILMNIK